MIIYETLVMGETHLLKHYMDICQSFEEPWPNINTGSIVFSDFHKISFYFLDDYNKELEQILPKISPFLFGAIGIFDWRSNNSFAYLKELFYHLDGQVELPRVVHAVNCPEEMPLNPSRIESGLVLNKMDYLYFSSIINGQELINALRKLIGLVSVQNDKFQTKNN